MSWDMVIADEVQKLQGRKTQQTRSLKGIKRVGQKFGFSGTPVEGHPAKFWSCLNWLYPTDYRGYWKFYQQFVDYEIIYPQGFHKILGPKNAAQLRAQIEPFYVRHLKKEQCCPHHPEGVMPWLPDKYYEEEYVDLGPEQRRVYNQMKADLISWVGAREDQPLVAPVVIAQLMRLQQFAIAYARIEGGGYDEVNDIHLPGTVRMSEPSSKLDKVMDILEDTDDPIVVWSNFKQPLYLLEERCKKAKPAIDILLYTGDNRATRDSNVVSFSRGGARVFAGTIASGGTGVDGLQYASSHCVFLDRHWNPARNVQAEDRLHRDGQLNAVQVTDIMARNTVDRGRKQTIARTWSWVKELLDG
jgi:SNF2 family DNA or RNA helicase